MLVHSKEYITEVKKKCLDIDPGYAMGDLTNEVYFSEKSYRAACLASHATIRGLETVLGLSETG